MDLSQVITRFWALPWQFKLLALFVLVVGTEMVLKRFAPESAFYRSWQRTFERIGTVWTAVILSIIYFISVAGVSLFMKLLGRDLLNTGLDAQPSFWQERETTPLSPQAAARHQF